MSSPSLATIKFTADSAEDSSLLSDCDCDCEDIALLPLPEEQVILHLLSARYAQNRMYSKCGDVLLAINPYCDVSTLLYTDEALFQYSSPRSLSVLDTLPPHPWKTAAKAFRCLVCGSGTGGDGDGWGGPMNQSIVISGESGSGKSETTKIILNFLAKIGSFSNANSRTTSLSDFQNLNMMGGHVQSRILQTNIILESLGNARTVRNDNSSRFGKLIQLLFHTGGKLEGACVETYLLELMRVVQQQETERNFHIFYMILTEKDVTRRKRLHLEAPSSYQYLLQTRRGHEGEKGEGEEEAGCFERRDGVPDADLYAGFTQALKILSVDEETKESLLGALVAVLTVGNFQCISTTNAEGETVIEHTVKSKQVLQLVADLLSVPADVLQTVLSTRSISAGGETFVVTLDSENITIMRNMFAKALYQSIFEWMIAFLNTTLSPTDVKAQSFSSIGLLDMFGFEDLSHNSLEQLLINYTNEHLQQQFDFMMIESEQALYVREGIEWDFIEFPSAQPCLDLVFSREKSLVGVLDEACRAPGGSDSSFINQVYQHFGKHECFSASPLQRGKALFGVRHYAGLVIYESTNFVAKNKVISFPLDSVLSESNSEFVKGLLKDGAGTTKDGGNNDGSSSNKTNSKQLKRLQSSWVADTVADSFCNNVNELLNKIQKTSSNYIKCFKPNSIHSKQNFVHAYVKDQMKYSGILHSLTVMRVGFPIRYTYLEFWNKYYPLILSLCGGQLHNEAPEAKKSFLEAVRRGDLTAMKKATGVVVDRLSDIENAGQLEVSPEFDTGCSGRCIQPGATVVFLRYSGHFTLQQMVVDVVGASVVRIQTRQRRNVERHRYLIQYRLVVNLQRICYAYLVRKRMRRRRLVLCRFVKNVTLRIVGRRLSRMLIATYRRLKLRQRWWKALGAIRLFTSICRRRMVHIKYHDRCEHFSRLLTNIYFKRKNELSLLDAFCRFRDMDSTNYEHYIHDKEGVAFAFRDVILKLQRTWRWKRKLFHELYHALHHNEEKGLSVFPLTKDSPLSSLKKQDRQIQMPFNTLRSQDLLRANRHMLWAVYANYVSMATTSPLSLLGNSLDQRDRYNVPALPLKYLCILMKDWDLCPHVVNPNMITNIVQLLTESEYYFLDFDEEVWGRRYPPPRSVPNSPSSSSSPQSHSHPWSAVSVSPPKAKGKHIQGAAASASGDLLLQADISFNLFCQVLLHIASALSNQVVTRRSSSLQHADSPPSVLSVTIADMEELGFQYSPKVALNLRLLLTAMDRSNGRNKLGNSRSSLPIASFVGVIGSEALSAGKMKKNGPLSKKHSSVAVTPRELVAHPMDAQVLAVVRKNRPQLLLLALQYTHLPPPTSTHLGSLTEKEKIALVSLAREDLWDLTVDFGLCPHHCSKQELMSICDLTQNQATSRAVESVDKSLSGISIKSNPRATPEKLKRVGPKPTLSVRTSLSPGAKSRATASLSPSRSGARVSGSTRGLTISVPHEQPLKKEKNTHLSYADFIKVLHVLSLNIVSSKRMDMLTQDFAEKQFSPLLHLMNLSSGREKLASTGRISIILPPFHLSTSPSLSFSPPPPASATPPSRLSLSPSKSPSNKSPQRNPIKVFNQTTPEPIGAAKSMSRVLRGKGWQPEKEEPPDFKF